MEISKKAWPLASISGLRDRIDTNPDFQRPAVWTRSQKQLLVDTILRGYDVPKLYLRKTGTKPDRFEVIDGQQRIRAVWDYFDGAYPLPRNLEPVDGVDVSGLGYADLPHDLRIAFDNYAFDIIQVTDTDDEEAREMFLRLQNGTTLKAQERRNAMPGNMRDFVRQIAEDPLFQSVAFANTRYSYDQVAAQLVAIEIAGGPCQVTKSALDRMYAEQMAFDADGPQAKKVKRVLKHLRKAFPEETPELERFSVVSLYLMVSDLLENYAFPGHEKRLATWFVDFETSRRAAAMSDDDEDGRDSDLITYQEKTSHATDSKDSLGWRHDYLMGLFLSVCPELPAKDPQRGFSHHQRLAVFRRDAGTCQLRIACKGAKVAWGNWHCDHKVPHAKGGTTSVANGQVACPACNQRKGTHGP